MAIDVIAFFDSRSTDPAHEVAGHSRGVPAVEPPAVPDRRDAGEAGTSGRVDVYSTEFLWTARRTGVHVSRAARTARRCSAVHCSTLAASMTGSSPS